MKRRHKALLTLRAVFLVPPLALVVFHLIPTSMRRPEDSIVNDHPLQLRTAIGRYVVSNETLNGISRREAALVTKIRDMNAIKKSLNESTVTESRLEEASFEEIALNADELASHGTALDALGRAGYIHDSTLIRRQHQLKAGTFPAWRATICQQKSPGYGEEGRMGYQGLRRLQIVRNQTNIRILCMIYTHSGHHETKVRAILETYAPHCDGFLAASNVTDPSLGAVHIKHIGNESYSNMWQKVRGIWKYAFDHYIDQYDFFHLGGDDMYVIPDNLRYLCHEFNQRYMNTTTNTTDKPLYMGGSIIGRRPKRRFCGGGSGYTLNRAALQLFMTKLYDDCMPTVCSSQEDRIIGDCFYRRKRTQCLDTSEKDTHATRYHILSADFQATWVKDLQHSRGLIRWTRLEKEHKIHVVGGLKGISPTSVSFHLTLINNKLQDNGIRRYHAILYGYCDEYWEKPVQALDRKGNPGYIHNVSFLRYNPLPFDKKAAECGKVPFGEGVEGQAGYRGLQKIKIQSPDPNHAPRVLCLVYTQASRHKTHLRAIAQTYGPLCDGFMAASTTTDATIGAVNLPHEGPEVYDNMWMKVRAIWEYVHRHYLLDFDVFHIGGDDYYLIVENFKHMVQTKSWRTSPNSSSEILYLGGSMVNFPYSSNRYCGGGSGYALNRRAVQVLVEQLFQTPACWPHFRQPHEDRLIASCFRSIGIHCMDTNDDRNESR
jgi:glycoprotein-N-acetylgalactosamine 3-beta-galactosyltransferase